MNFRFTHASFMVMSYSFPLCPSAAVLGLDPSFTQDPSSPGKASTACTAPMLKSSLAPHTSFDPMLLIYPYIPLYYTPVLDICCTLDLLGSFHPDACVPPSVSLIMLCLGWFKCEVRVEKHCPSPEPFWKLGSLQLPPFFCAFKT